jgi:N-acetyl-gamma-glutamyl-phosphate reductase
MLGCQVESRCHFDIEKRTVLVLCICNYKGQKMIHAAVIGATGYAGAELVRLLAGHPDVELTMLTSRQYAGVRFDQVFPATAAMVDRVCQPYDPDAACRVADYFFLALPHKLPMAFVPELYRRGKKVIDLSADFRFEIQETYEAHYQPHSCPGLLKEAVYGLCELYTEKIRKAALVGNPGCYPTSVLLPMVPLLKAGLVDSKTLVADSKSGVSGAGRSATLTSHFCEVTESFKAYKVAAHRHNPEMDAVLSREAAQDVHVTFVPHLVPMSRGMLTTQYATLAREACLEEIRETVAAFYRNRPFIRICSGDRLPDTRNVRGTNFCDIGFRLDADHRRLIVISAIDNLVKGAAGQAVQNMNLMAGLEETAGLWNVPFPL